jgi:hypothetical protein
MSETNNFNDCIPIGKSLNLEYLGPTKPQIILKIIRIPTIYPIAEWKFSSSSSSLKM